MLASAVAKQGLDDPVSDLNLINSVKADLSFDQTWPVSDMVNLVLDFHAIDIGSVPQLTLPVQVVSDPDGSGGSLQYAGYSYGDVEFPAQAQDVAAIDQLLGIGATIDPLTGKPLPTPSSVSVSVLNGTGGANQAADTAAALTALGYHVVGVGDTAPVGDVSETYVYYGSRSTQSEAAAESVARRDVRLGRDGVRPGKGDRRCTGHGGDRLTVLGQRAGGTGHGHHGAGISGRDLNDVDHGAFERFGGCHRSTQLVQRRPGSMGPEGLRPRCGASCTVAESGDLSKNCLEDSRPPP